MNYCLHPFQSELSRTFTLFSIQCVFIEIMRLWQLIFWSCGKNKYVKYCRHFPKCKKLSFFSVDSVTMTNYFHIHKYSSYCRGYWCKKCSFKNTADFFICRSLYIKLKIWASILSTMKLKADRKWPDLLYLAGACMYS